MAVKQVMLSFPPSASADVAGYKLYIQESPDAVTFASEMFDIGNTTSVDLASIDGMTTKDGSYNIGITAYDDAGNESSMSTLNDVALDFVEPDPPGEITITRV